MKIERQVNETKIINLKVVLEFLYLNDLMD